MGAKRTYSDKERAAALALLDANNGNVTRTSQESGIPAQTISEWRDGRTPDIREEKKEARITLAEQLEKSALSIATKLESATSDSPAALATALGIIVDKLLVLNGQPNAISRTESAPLTNEERADKVVRLFERIGTKSA